MTLAVCWKWVSSSDGPDDPTPAGPGCRPPTRPRSNSPSSCEPTHGAVTVVCVGPPGADAVLREALAAGADGAVRIDVATSTRDSRERGATHSRPVVGDADFVRVRRLLAGPRHRVGARRSSPTNSASPRPSASSKSTSRPDDRHRHVAGVCAASTADDARSSTSIRRPSCRWRARSAVCAGPSLAATVSIQVGRRRGRSPSPALDAGAAARTTVRRPLVDPVPAARPHTARADGIGAHPGARDPRRRRATTRSRRDGRRLAPAEAAARILDQLRRWGHLRFRLRAAGLTVRLGDATWRDVSAATDDRSEHRRCAHAGAADPGRVDRTARSAPTARHRHADRRGDRRPGDPHDRRPDDRPDDLGLVVG